MKEPTYDREARSRHLRALLRALAARISELDASGRLLASGPELLKLMGDARSELFQYEVRLTYDSPEIAEHRRIVDAARKQLESQTFGEETPEWDNGEGDEPWRSR